MEDVVLGYDTVEAYLADTYNFGALVGRNANRIGGASLELNGVTYHLAVNSGLRDNLHSGPELYGRRKWRAEQVALEGAEGLQFSLSSPDGGPGLSRQCGDPCDLRPAGRQCSGDPLSDGI